VREAAARMTCQNNLKQIGLGIHNYASAYQDKVPSILTYDGGTNGVGWNTFWGVLLNFVEQDNIYKRAINQGCIWGNGVANIAGSVPIYLCPSDPTYNSNGQCTTGSGWAACSYGPVDRMFGIQNYSNGYTGSLLGPNYKIGNIPDGSSNQIAVVERWSSYPAYGWSNAWAYPEGGGTPWGWNPYGSAYGPWGLQYTPQYSPTKSANNAVHPYYPNTGHSTCQCLLMDGHVKGFGPSVGSQTWQWACTPDDGNVLGADMP